MSRKTVILFAVIFMLGSVSALSSIGTAPGYQDLGTIERGETRETEFYITSDASAPFELNAGFSDPLYSRIFEGDNEIESEFSHEDIEPWVDFPGNPYLITPNDTSVRNLDNGAPVTSEGTVNVEISVPQDAEPGYRAGMLNLNPVSQDSSDTFGAANYGIARPTFSFRVPGEVEREIDIEGVRARRIGDDAAQIVAEFRNTGTVTTRMDGKTISVLNEANQEVGQVTFSMRELAPGEIVREDVTWTGDNVEGGEYHLEGTMNFMTGNFYVGSEYSSFVITSQIQDRVEVEESSEPAGEGESGASPFLVLIFLILVGVVLYSFDIDPFLILVALAGIALITVVLSTSIPLWVIPVLLIGGVAVMYYA